MHSGVGALLYPSSKSTLRARAVGAADTSRCFSGVDIQRRRHARAPVLASTHAESRRCLQALLLHSQTSSSSVCLET